MTVNRRYLRALGVLIVTHSLPPARRRVAPSIRRLLRKAAITSSSNFTAREKLACPVVHQL